MLCIVQVLYSGPGGGAADFQTITLELPTDTLKKRKPTFGNKTFLQIETKPEDDISNVPFKVCTSFLRCLHSRESVKCAENLLCLQGILNAYLSTL